MKFSVKTGSFNTLHMDCIVVGVYEKNELTPEAKQLDKASKGVLSQLIKSQELPQKMGETFLIHTHLTSPTKRILIVGLGKNKPLSIRDYRCIVLNCMKSLLLSKVHKALFCLTDLAVEKQTTEWKLMQSVELYHAAAYRFTSYQSKPAPLPVLKEIDFLIEDKHEVKAATKAISQSQSIAEGVDFTKDLGNQPSNVCTPSYLADEAKQLGKHYKKIKTTVLEDKALKKIGMNTLLAVGKGSAEAPKCIILEYQGGKKNEAPIAFVGKGITFDTGGISLKPADAMVGMKYDMCGAATVLGVLKTVAELNLPLNIIGVIPTAENMPSGTACKPEDIVKTLSGQTVEIMNTDAEGRLILCDALTYCERFKPETVIDIATLTGAVVIALGYHATGLLSNHEPLAQELLTAGIDSHDRAWQLPLWEDYQDQLKSPFADMSNVGGRAGGAITAACFLSRFTKKFKWAHLDVAGTAAMMGGNDRYATGRPVPLLIQFLLNRCASNA